MQLCILAQPEVPAGSHRCGTSWHSFHYIIYADQIQFRHDIYVDADFLGAFFSKLLAYGSYAESGALTLVFDVSCAVIDSGTIRVHRGTQISIGSSIRAPSRRFGRPVVT